MNEPYVFIIDIIISMNLLQSFLDSAKEVPDSIKIVASVAPPGLYMAGLTLQEWTFVLSLCVSALFVIEKIPMLIERIKGLVKWMRELRKISKE